MQIVLAALTSALPLAQSDKVRFVAITNNKRAPTLPEVPTVTEAGYPELAFEGFRLPLCFGNKPITTMRLLLSAGLAQSAMTRAE
jgi:hypothetical protein